jgi:acid phosphatase
MVEMRLAGLFFLCFTSVRAQAPHPHENLNAVLWVQTAAEYQAAARQAYRAAEETLEHALRDPNWTAALEQSRDLTGDYAKMPPAVIVDLDETVIDNSVFQAQLTVQRRAYSEQNWQKWVEARRAGLVPGAREFVAFAHARGVAVYYVTNRSCDPGNADDPTAAQLRSFGLPVSPQRLLCRTDSGDKSPRRKRVSQMYRVLLIIGDDLNDFATLPFDVAARAAFVTDMGRYWGERWFMIPNPTYGSWERSVGIDLERKWKAMRR